MSSTEEGEVVRRQVLRLEPGTSVNVGRDYSESARSGVNADRCNARRAREQRIDAYRGGRSDEPESPGRKNATDADKRIT